MSPRAAGTNGRRLAVDIAVDKERPLCGVSLLYSLKDVAVYKGKPVVVSRDSPRPDDFGLLDQYQNGLCLFFFLLSSIRSRYNERTFICMVDPKLCRHQRLRRHKQIKHTLPEDTESELDN